MNEALVVNWNSVVKPEDVVYYLGDFSLAFRAIELYSHRLNGTKYLVPGNHDLCHTYNKRSRTEGGIDKWIKKYEDHGWIVLPEQTSLNIPGVANVQMCHHPFSGDYPSEDGYDKYAKWRPKDDGRWLICGHVHEKFKVKDRMINVGIDSWGMKPVSIEDVSKIILET
jgi:calcineurin-like phosphoesterase family protein